MFGPLSFIFCCYFVLTALHFKAYFCLVRCFCFCFCQLDISQGSSWKKEMRLANVFIRLALGKSEPFSWLKTAVWVQPAVGCALFSTRCESSWLWAMRSSAHGPGWHRGVSWVGYGPWSPLQLPSWVLTCLCFTVSGELKETLSSWVVFTVVLITAAEISHRPWVLGKVSVVFPSVCTYSSVLIVATTALWIWKVLPAYNILDWRTCSQKLGALSCMCSGVAPEEPAASVCPLPLWCVWLFLDS